MNFHKVLISFFLIQTLLPKHEIYIYNLLCFNFGGFVRYGLWLIGNRT